MEEEQRPLVRENRLIEELRMVLRSLSDKARGGGRPRLVDARSFLRNKLTLDFADYFKFLKRYNYVVISRGDQSLAVTDEGVNIVDQGPDEEFLVELREHFKHFLAREEEQLIDMPEEEMFAEVERQKEAERQVQVTERADRKEGRNMPDNHQYAKGTKIDSRYTRYDAIGSGGIGTVYRARHNALLIDVAIKEIKELFTYFNFLQRSEVIRHLKDVVEKMAMLNHPLVVRVIDANTEVAHPFFVMEYLPGGSLKERLEGRPLELERALIVFTQIAYALREAHARGVVHGNLKPENVLFDAQGNVRLTDFGITSLLKTDANRSVPQLVAGSIAYLSPEQMKDRSLQDVSSDIYALGILFYEMLTGHIPGRRSPLPSETGKDIPQAADDLFEKMTRDDPGERYGDFDAVLGDFYKHFPADKYLSLGRMILFGETVAEDDSPREQEQDE